MFFFRNPCLCCPNVEHCPNVKNPDQADSLLQKVDHFSQSIAEGGARQKGNNETAGDGGVERPLGR